MKVIYRISDAGYKKEKPDYINNQNCFINALRTFNKADWLIIADNVGDETKSLITQSNKEIKYVNVGHGAGTFNLALDYIDKTRNVCIAIQALSTPKDLVSFANNIDC